MLARILAAMSAQSAPRLAVERTAAALRGKSLGPILPPYLVVSHDPSLNWGPVMSDDHHCFDRERFFVLETRDI